MKKLFLTLSLFVSLGATAQTDSTAIEQDSTEQTEFDKFVKYEVCMTCGDQWKNGGKVPQNNYQSRIVNENNAARQAGNNGRHIVKAVVGTVVAAVVASVTYALITRTNKSVNEVLNP